MKLTTHFVITLFINKGKQSKFIFKEHQMTHRWIQGKRPDMTTCRILKKDECKEFCFVEVEAFFNFKN